MTDIDIAAIRQREQAATKGPWEAAVDDHGRGQVDASVWSDELSYYIAEKISSGPNHVADAEFIAHARTDVPALLAKVAELTVAQDRAAKRIDGLRDYILAALDSAADWLASDEMRNASIDLADALADLGHPVANEDEDPAPRRPIVTVELPAEVTR